LVHDAFLHDPRAAFVKFDILADPAPNFDSSRPAPQLLAADACRHDYALKIDRLESPPRDYRPAAGDKFGADALCRKCRTHLQLSFQYPHDATQPCPSADYPLHHFVLFSVDPLSKYDFVCSAPSCNATAQITYASPVIADSDIDLLTNPEYLRKRYHDAVTRDPTRTGFMLGTPVSTLWKLRRYLRDSHKPDSVGKKIPVENKRFLESFGSDCSEIFKRLGFTWIV